MQNKTEYDASDIKVLTGLDAIRSRPGMYIGDVEDGSGLANLVLEVVNFYLNELPNNQSSKISIVINENNEVEICATDIELPVHEVEGKSVIEKLMTELTTAKNQLIIINALSSKVLITTTNEENFWNQIYNNGVPKPLEKMGKANYSGTTVRFLPNKKYFSNVYFDHAKLTTKLKEFTYLYKDLLIDFEDRSIRKAQFHNPKGLVDCVFDLIPSRTKAKHELKTIEITGFEKDFKLKAVLFFSDECAHQVSFVNNEKTIEGGTHQKGVVAGIAQAIKITSGCKLSAVIWKQIVEQGLYVAISVEIPIPCWAGSTRDRLCNKDVYTKTKSIVFKYLLRYFDGNHIFRKKLLKAHIEQYLYKDYSKNHEKHSYPTPEYAKSQIAKMFKQPENYQNIVDDFIEFERLSEECLKHQAKDD